MFDAIAPRYDLVNRIMTFRLDVRWRRRAVRALELAPGSRVLDLASGTGDLCIDLARAGYLPVSVDLSYGMLIADRSGAPRVQADILRLPVPDRVVDGVTCGFALRNLVELPAFFAELGRVVRPGGRIALLDVGIPRNRIVRWGNGIYFGKVVPRIGGLSVGPGRLPVPSQERRLPSRTRRHDPVASRRRIRRCVAPPAVGWHHPAPARHTWMNMRAVTRPLEGVLDLNDVAGGDGYLFVRDGVGVAGRGVAARVPYDEAPARARIDRARRTAGGAGGPVAIGVLPFLPDSPAELVIPSAVVRKCADGTAWVTVIDDAEQPVGRAPARPVAASYDIRPAVDVAHYLRAVESARDMVRGRRDRQGRDRPADHGDVGPSDRRPRRARTARGPASVRAIASRSTGSSGRPPNCSWRSRAT